jgi:hypothetical protein
MNKKCIFMSFLLPLFTAFVFSNDQPPASAATPAPPTAGKATDPDLQFVLVRNLNTLPKDVIPDFSNNDFRILRNNNSDADIPRASRFDYIVVQIYPPSSNSSLDPNNCAVQVTLTSLRSGSTGKQFTMSNSSTQSTKSIQPFYLYLGGIPILPNSKGDDIIGEIQASPGDIIKAEFSFSANNNTVITKEKYFYYSPYWVPYNMGTSPVGYGLNLPIGLSAFSYVANQGLTATVQPFALGWGWKFYPSTDTYFGLDLAVGYTGYAGTSSSSSGSTNFTFTSLTYALYLDLSDLFFIGGGYTYNTVSRSSLGWQLLAGIGTNVSSFLKK